jgi:predicted O-methyltransferase YrrM
LPQPIDLIIIDIPEINRPSATIAALDVISPGGFILVKEPEVPTGDVGVPEDGQEPNEAQKKVHSFNNWMEIIRDCNINHSMAFVELSGGTLAVIRRSV